VKTKVQYIDVDACDEDSLDGSQIKNQEQFNFFESKKITE
jgi:hypothetical protein